MLEGKRILLIVTGGIAAFKSLDLIRRLRERGAAVRCVLTKSGAQFVTPLSLQAISEDKVYGDLFSLTDESEMGHIRLSREADLLVVAPATADILAKLAHGLADDLASTVLLASDKTVLAAPAMNLRMWDNPATVENLRLLKARGLLTVGPNDGAMACGEFGPGRMAEPLEIVAAIEDHFSRSGALAGRRALITSGPTREPIDPVRYISNHSSGKQGHAIAAALARLGAETVLVSGPTAMADPHGVRVVHIETAQQMLEASLAALPVDVAVCAAAVADWRVKAPRNGKIKKEAGAAAPSFELIANPDILATLAQAGGRRPQLLIGFAAETDNVVEHAIAKRARKGCDWILANDVSPATGIFGGDRNTVHLIGAGPGASGGESGIEHWPTMDKDEIARLLASRIAAHLAKSVAA